ncbi:unnamed protein product [Camellia sinensis]
MAFVDYIEDDILSNKGSRNNESISNEFGSSSWSGWSSPIESELGSTETETESEEEDGFIAELTRQMADYMLDDDDDDDEVAPSSLPKTTKNPNVGFEANQASSYDQTPAIHLYKFEKQPSINDKGYECGGSRVKRNELTQQLHDKKRHHIPIMQKSVARADDVSAGRIGPSSATTWRPSRQQPIGSDSGSGMRAVFLGGPRLQNGSSGTGVFLPRGTSDPPESRKKSGCSTVLIPARVMQALQLHFEDMNARSKSNGRGGFISYPLQHDIVMAPSNSDIHLQPKQQSQPRTGGPAVNHHETVLPKEWTY